ncbi:serine hydrolase domain-containing protein [Kineococcus gynurae]|uniref:Serine hydrolase domain-containing protein n=1 Tax=Kineococcus gynurae TaxID=452979 RepID=A0ABV5LRA5_9ACTN
MGGFGSAPSMLPPVAADPFAAARERGDGRLRWTFQHIGDLVPTARIGHGTVAGPELPFTDYRPDRLRVVLPSGGTASVAQVMDLTDTNGWTVLHDDPRTGPSVLVERYVPEMTPATPHLLMSVTKSVAGIVAGALAGRGLLHLEAPVTYYVPALMASGYNGATVRHLLDMRSGVRFREDYLDPSADVNVIEQAFGWVPRRSPDVPATLREFLLRLRQEGPHGGPFLYRSCESDVLGWVLEAATGARFADLAADLVWSRIGARHDANIGVDAEGSAMCDGGMSATLSDLARFGLMLLRGGTSLTGAEVVPGWWMQDTLLGGPDSAEAFAASPGDNRMPGGFYRNQFWIPDVRRPVLLGLGIHGQMLYVNLRARVVAVKLSSWPVPQDAYRLFSTVAAFDAIAAHVSP